MRQKFIVPLLKEFFAYDNPFNGTARYSLKSTAVISPIEKAGAAKGSPSAAVIPPIAVIKKAGATKGSSMAAVVSPIAVIGATEGSSMAVVVSQTATTVSPPPPIGRVNQECARSINAILSSLQIKETSPKLSNSTAVKTHRSKSATKKSSVSVLADFLKATNIPAQDALKFFEKKKRYGSFLRNSIAC
jgi:hypothetical protein